MSYKRLTRIAPGLTGKPEANHATRPITLVSSVGKLGQTVGASEPSRRAEVSWHNRFMLKVKKLSPDATLPTVAHPGEDIGYDLYSVEDITIAAHGAAGVHTGIAIEFMPTAGGIVKTRSGLAKKRLLCNAGVIDAGYRGEIIVLMENLGDQPYSIRKGDKIAQLLEHPFLAGEVLESDLSDAARGSKGFGSSGA